MSTTGIALVALVIAVGLVGVAVPLLPGTLLVFAAIAVWAVAEHTPLAWVTLAVVAAVMAATLVVKYLWPVRRMRRAEVGAASLLAGAVLGVIGFFVVPVLGLPIGFVLGVFLVELAQRRDRRLAWTSTVHAIKGVLLSVGVEFCGALLATGVWVAGVVASAP